MLPYRHWQKSLRLLWVLLTAGGRLPWSLSDLRLTARFLPFPPEASLLLASSGPPSFAFAALHGGFSSLSLSALFGMRVLRLAYQKQASCLLLPGRLRSLSPPSMAAFLRYRLSALFGMRVLRLAYQKQASCLLLPGRLRSLPPPSMAAFLRYRLSALFGRRVLRLAYQKQASCLLLPGRLRSLPPPSMAAFLRYRLSALFGRRVYDSPPPEASLLLASSGPPSFASAALHKRSLREVYDSPFSDFSSLSLKRSLREASLRLALQQQASCMLLPGRLRSLPPPSMAAFLRYRLSALFGRRVYDSPPPEASLLHPPPSMATFLRYRLSALFGRRVYDSPFSSKPPACFFRAAFVRFRRPPWRLFFAIA